MGFIFKLFKIIGIDLSKYNDNPNTPQVVDPQKVVDTGIDFTAIRSTVGKWLDPKFKQFWAALRGFVLRIQYHYMDYWSHTGLGLTAEQWGQVQAQTAYDSTKDDNDGCPAFLDIEKASFAARIEDVLPLVQSIAKAFLLKLDALNGKKNGMYLPLSYIKYFLFAKDRPLWLALYNEYYTPEQAVALARSKGWTGPIYMWQYASDGDIDDDGVADGLKIGVESRTVDLNIWVGTEEEFKNFGTITGATPEPVVVLIPNLNVPAFNQNDERWRNIILGTSKYTIGSHGCQLCNIAARLKSLGKDTDPARLNKDLIRVKGYESDSLIIYDAITKIYPDVTVDWDNFIPDAAQVTDARIDAVLQSGRSVSVKVDSNPKTTAVEPHWVNIIGKDSRGYIIIDPNGGVTVPLSDRYFKPLLRMIVFNGKVEIPVPVELTDPEKLKRLWDWYLEMHK